MGEKGENEFKLQLTGTTADSAFDSCPLVLASVLLLVVTAIWLLLPGTGEEENSCMY